MTPQEVVDRVFPELFPDCGEHFLDPRSGPTRNWWCHTIRPGDFNHEWSDDAKLHAQV